MTRIVVLRTGQAEPAVFAKLGSFTDVFAAHLAKHGAVVHDVDATQLAHPATNALWQHADGVIVTGSPAYVGDDEPWMRALAALLRDVVRAEVPLLGVCFGHQILAHAMGCEVAPNPRGRQAGTITVELTNVDDDPLFSRLPRRFLAQCTHRDVVRDPRGRVAIVGRTAHDPHHVLRAGPRAWGVQFHPEFNVDAVRLFLEARREALDAEHGTGTSQTRIDNLAEALDAPLVLSAFVDVCVAKTTRMQDGDLQVQGEFLSGGA